jgi:hypothetical protein
MHHRQERGTRPLVPRDQYVALRLQFARERLEIEGIGHCFTTAARAKPRDFSEQSFSFDR